jgi:hypothetical protein
VSGVRFTAVQTLVTKCYLLDDDGLGGSIIIGHPVAKSFLGSCGKTTTTTTSALDQQYR